VFGDNAEILQLVADNRDHHHHGAREYAVRDRRLATALLDAAEALATRPLPSEEIQEIIRNP
jgi:hypothetical protein